MRWKIFTFISISLTIVASVVLASLRIDAVHPYFNLLLKTMVYEVRVSGSLESVNIQEFRLGFTMEGFVDYTFGVSPVFSHSWSYSGTSSSFYYKKVDRYSVSARLGGHYYLNVCCGNVVWTFRPSQTAKVMLSFQPLSETMTEYDRDSAKTYFWYDPEEWPVKSSPKLP